MFITRIIVVGILLAIIGLATRATFGLLSQGEINADATNLQAALTHAKAASNLSPTASTTFTFTVSATGWSGESLPFSALATGHEPLSYAVNNAPPTQIRSTFTLSYENGRFMGATTGSQPVLSCSAAPPSGLTYNTLTLFLATSHVAVSC